MASVEELHERNAKLAKEVQDLRSKMDTILRDSSSGQPGGQHAPALSAGTGTCRVYIRTFALFGHTFTG